MVLAEGCLRVAFLFQIAGDPDPYVVTHHWGITSGTTDPAVLDAFAASSLDTWYSVNESLIPVAVEGIGYEWQATVDGETLSGSGIPGVALVGTLATTIAPPNVAMLVTRKSATGGRRGKGRFFQPGVSEASVDNVGQLALVTRNAWVTGVNTWIADCLTLDGTSSYVINSKGNDLGTLAVMREVTSIGVSNLVATQRRRLRK